jgi:hypothetical protein
MADTGSFDSVGKNAVTISARAGGEDQSGDRVTSDLIDGMNMISRFIDGDFRTWTPDELHAYNWLQFLRNRWRGKRG